MAQGMEPRELQAALSGLVLPGRASSALPAGHGAAVVVGEYCCGPAGWLVAGRPVSDPWGVPGAGASLDQAAAAFDRYGAAAVQTVAGPYVAVDLRHTAVVRALNGIVPLFMSTRGRWVVSTERGVAAALSGEGEASVPPGTSVRPDRSASSWAAPLPVGDVAGFPWAWVDSVVSARIPRLGIGPEEGLGDDVRSAEDEWSMFLPRLARLGRRGGGLREYLRLREVVLPALWERSLLKGRWLCAPAFERPVLDTIAMLVPPAEVRLSTG